MGRADEPTFDPTTLTTAQRDGEACAVCRKKWPRPRHRVGRLPDSSGVFACDDCAPALPAPRAKRAPRETATNAGAPAARPVPAGATVSG